MRPSGQMACYDPISPTTTFAFVFVNGSQNVITALGSCYAISVQGSHNTIIADNVVNDITVYGFNQKVLYKSGEPAIIDRGRELGMMNFIDRVPG
ncbi:putative transmembrane protein [Mycobacteroides abscessus subsp. abscessus]|nr:putative transmembrane protein [Mycobacteroides abscessus subsp. abscessus]